MMKLFNYATLFFILFFGFYKECSAQQDTLYYDTATGNYIIQYLGTYVYIQGADGSLRFYSDDRDVPGEGEEFVMKDSLATAIFEPATKIDPMIVCAVTYNQQTNRYTYSYTIENGMQSQQNLYRFILEFDVEDVSDESTNWSGDRIREWRDNKISISNRWAWTGDQGLEPTWSTNGFVLGSPGLPGIMNAYFQGLTPILTFPCESPGGELGSKIAGLTVFPANHVIRKTLAPVDIDDSVMPLAFVDTLISYKHQAFDLGWIDNQGIQNSLDQKLDNAKKQLDKGKTKQAVNMLNAFLNEVEAQNGKHLTSEAYALLKYNAEYLIEKLEE